jgi:hypothetical protein
MLLVLPGRHGEKVSRAMSIKATACDTFLLRRDAGIENRQVNGSIPQRHRLASDWDQRSQWSNAE